MYGKFARKKSSLLVNVKYIKANLEGIISSGDMYNIYRMYITHTMHAGILLLWLLRGIAVFEEKIRRVHT